MAHYPFNGASLTYAGLTGLEVTSFSMEGGDRAEVDVTSSSSTVREVIPGFASPRRLTFGINYQGDHATLRAELDDCATGALVVSLGADCGAPASHIGLDAWLMSFSLNAELDGIVTGDLSFLIDERPGE